MVGNSPDENKNREAAELAWMAQGPGSRQMERPEGFTKTFLQ